MERSYEANPESIQKSHAKQNGYNTSTSTENNHETSKEHLEQIRPTATNISMSPEMFEKLYLTPENRVHGQLRKTFGNPTPIAIIGFVVSLTPLCVDLMGWRGSGGSGAAQVGAFYFIGGLLLLVGGIFEFFLGNTFPFVVFTSFSGFWFAFGATLTPSFNAMGAYSASGSNGPEGAATMGFNASFGFYLLTWTFLTFIYLICSLRTNVAFVIVFLFLDGALGLLTGAYFSLAEGKADLATTLLTAGGASGFVCCASGWYILLAQLLAALDFPIELPVGDLSGFITSASERRARKNRRAEDSV